MRGWDCHSLSLHLISIRWSDISLDRRDRTQWSVSYIYVTVNSILTSTALFISTKSSDWPDVCYVFSLCNLTSAQCNVWQTDRCLMPDDVCSSPAQVVSTTLSSLFTGNVRWWLPTLCSPQAAPPVTAELPKISGPGCLRPGPAAPGASAAVASGHADIDTQYSIFTFYKSLNFFYFKVSIHL